MYFLIMIVLILVIFLFIIPTIWCYNPAILVNLKYQTNIGIESFKEPTLFISTHDDTFGHHDQILVCQEAIKTNLKLNIVSWHDEADSISRFLKKLPLFAKYNLLYTGNNLVQKAREKLKDQHVWMFLKKDWKNKGPYHILNDKNKKNLVLVKIKNKDNIKSDNNILSKTFNRKIEIEYNKIEDYNLDQGAEKFMEFLKKELYLN